VATVSWKGRLLVASPILADPNFARSVVLLLAHAGEGAFGLVLNRPSGASVAEVLPRWAEGVAPPGVLFRGGPVATGAAIGLVVRARREPDVTPETGEPAWGLFDSGSLAGLVGTVELGARPVGLPPASLRVFLGSAGWAGGQLEDEVEAGAWFVVPAEPADLLSTRPERLWPQILRRQPGSLAILANYPTDLRAN